jgi:hypothetical protein
MANMTKTHIVTSTWWFPSMLQCYHVTVCRTIWTLHAWACLLTLWPCIAADYWADERENYISVISYYKQTSDSLSARIKCIALNKECSHTIILQSMHHRKKCHWMSCKKYLSSTVSYKWTTYRMEDTCEVQGQCGTKAKYENFYLWIKPTDAPSSSFIGITALHVSGSLSSHHQEL